MKQTPAKVCQVTHVWLPQLDKTSDPAIVSILVQFPLIVTFFPETFKAT